MGENEEKVDYLEVDDSIPGQNYVCLSFVSSFLFPLQSLHYFFFHSFKQKRGRGKEGASMPSFAPNFLKHVAPPAVGGGRWLRPHGREREVTVLTVTVSCVCLTIWLYAFGR